MIPKLDDYKHKWGVESDQSIKPGLEAIRNALASLNNPHNNLNIVHIAGTNGKGSTLTFLEQIARQHRLTVGKFMSPCIVDVHDQIQINGQPISEEDLDNIFLQMKKANLSGMLTDFELLTCAAFLHFQQKDVDLVLLEAGMGGREDSTNVVSPIVSIISSIALEHTKFLGPTIESIASHKAGIIKEGKPVVIGRLPEGAFRVIEQEASKNHAHLIALGDHFSIDCSIASGDVYINDENGLQIDFLKRTLPGNHQGDNMALAITAFFEVAQYFRLAVDLDKIREGVKLAALPGRFEQVYPNVYFDGAHNPASAQKLAKTIQQQFPNEAIRFVIGMLADKDVTSVLRALETVSEEFYFVDFTNERAMKAENMLAISNAATKQIVKESIPFIQGCSRENGKTIVTGSLYLLAEIRQALLK